MSKYLITLKWEFEAFDDIQARQIANNHIAKLGIVDIENWKKEIKLQEIKDNSVPRKIKL